MLRPSFSRSAVAVAILSVAALLAARAGVTSAAPAVDLPQPAMDTPRSANPNLQTAVFSGGCFWGIEAVFEHVKGVTDVVSGYAGGAPATANYEIVSTGATGHAESVKVTYDSSKVSYGQLLRVFFSVAHDPTQLNRQGPDHGTQYRSAIWYANDDQKKVADAYIAQLTAAHTFRKPIVTQVAPLKAFHAAEAYHQNYMVHHPNEAYIVINDAPKVENLKAKLPELYTEPTRR